METKIASNFVWEMVVEHANRKPDAVALVYGDESISYKQLIDRSEQLAFFLNSKGVGPEVKVGVFLENGLDLIIAILGILKSGGAYIPMDPKWPLDRLQYVLDDAAPATVMTSSELEGHLPGYKKEIVLIDHIKTNGLHRGQSNPFPQLNPNNLAYVIYTSGSTGRPKGVLVSHKGLLNLVKSQTHQFEVGPESCIFQFASISFDASVSEVFMALCSGARLILACSGLNQPDLQFVSLLNKNNVSHITLPPSFLSRLPKEKLNTLTHVIVAGESCPPKLARIFSQDRKFYNAYGPTEASVCATIHPCEQPGSVVPIGTPISNTKIYILDPELHPVPEGVQGEIYINGIGLARGYANNPGLTAENFIPDPFSSRSGERMYRTGDLGLRQPDGNIVFKGRKDRQVKVRGYRIELREIEFVLADLPLVSQVAVIVQEVGPMDLRIIAFVVPVTGAVLSPKDLKENIRKRLPEYMVPNHISVVESLPENSSGKVDYSRLEFSFTPDSEEEHITTLSGTEQIISSIWKEVLKNNSITVDQNFIELGGYSLLAGDIVTRINSRLGTNLSLDVVFLHPTIAKLSNFVDEQREDNQEGEQSLPLLPVSRSEPLPLSCYQEPLWFLIEMYPGSPIFNDAATIHFDDVIDVKAMEKAINEIQARHEPLRTHIQIHEGIPIQVIMPPVYQKLQIMDLRHLPADIREKEAKALGIELASEPFDYGAELPYRTLLIQLASDKWKLILVSSYLNFDAASLFIYLKELGVLYEAFSNAEPSPLPPNSVHYADFAYWQRKWMDSETIADQLAYWKQKLNGKLPRLNLPKNFPIPSSRTFQGRKQGFTFSSDLSIKVIDLARKLKVSPFMITVTAFTVLLHRYSGQTDILIGTSKDNRNQKETEGMIGYLINILVLRFNLDNDQPFSSLLSDVKETVLEAYGNQDLPFHRLVEALAPKRVPGVFPLVQVLFNFDEREPFETLNWDFNDDDIDSGYAKFDLLFSLAKNSDLLSGYVEYSTEAFQEDTINRFISHYEALLQGIVENPQSLISHFPSGEEETLIKLSKGTRMNIPAACVHQLIENRAAQNPNQVAIMASGPKGTREITYQELNNRANELAGYLRYLGVSPEVFTGLCLNRSPEMIIGILGILKAGGAYVPIDPNYPVKRLDLMIQQSGISIMVTSGDLPDGIIKPGLTVVAIDQDLPKIPDSANSTKITAPPSLQQLVYVIFTSGSTGKPKGVLTQHGCLTNYAFSTVERFNLTEKDRVLQLASISFDVAVEEIFPILVAGGSLVLFDEKAPGAPLEVLKKCNDWKISVIDLPTAFWHHLVQELDQPASALPESLRLMIVGGEQMHSDRLISWQNRRNGKCSLINAYGPTEATVDTLHYPIPEAGSIPQRVPIGRPLPNTESYILDRNLSPVPVGIIGEIYLGGPGLARGYLEQPGLTADRFIPHPFSEIPGERLYRTGDLGAYMSDGNIIFHGRMDKQVKVRGYRIELDEVEVALVRHPNVKEAVVKTQIHHGAHQRLVAYIVLDNGLEGLPRKLRDFLRDYLPHYMVPSAYVVIDKIPLGPTGKVDHSALPVSGINTFPEAQLHVPPSTLTGHKLAHIWRKMLNLPRVGIKDNFFDLGGHSLGGITLLAKVREVFGRQIQIGAFFQDPTIEKLMVLLDSEEERVFPAPLIPLATEGTGIPLFCFPGNGGIGADFLPLSAHLGSDGPVFSFDTSQRFPGVPRFPSVISTADYCLKALEAILPKGPCYIAGHSSGGMVALEVAKTLMRKGREVRYLFLFDSPAFPEPFPWVKDWDNTQWKSAVVDWLKQIPSQKGNIYEMISGDSDAENHYRTIIETELDYINYHPEPDYPGRIVVFRASEDMEMDKMGLLRDSPDDPSWGWDQISRYPVEVHASPGNHMSMLREPNIGFISDKINAYLKELAVSVLNHER